MGLVAMLFFFAYTAFEEALSQPTDRQRRKMESSEESTYAT